MNFWATFLFSSLFFVACQQVENTNGTHTENNLPQDSLRVRIEIFSGNPNPLFSMYNKFDSTTLKYLENKFLSLCDSSVIANPETRKAKTFPTKLGYDGIKVSRSRGSDTVFFSTSYFWIFTGTLQLFHDNPPSVCKSVMAGLDSDLYFPDSGFEIEKKLVEEAKNHNVISDSIYQYILSKINAR